MPRFASGLLLALWAVSATAQPVPNPYVSLLPPGVEADYEAWRARMQHPRAARKALPVVEEQEPSDTTGLNDTQPLAEVLEEFSADAPVEVEVRGYLFAPEPRDFGTIIEEADDGSIPLARDIGVVAGERVRAKAFIGDGPHGSEGSGTGDYDFYRLEHLDEGQYVVISTMTDDDEDPPLDTKVGLYNSSGNLVDSNDDRRLGGRDSFLEVRIEEPDEYFAAVRGINSAWPGDPFDPGSGPKAGSEGTYVLTIGVDARDVDWYGLPLSAGDALGASLEGDADKISLHDPEEAERMGISFDVSSLYPAGTPYPVGGNATLAYLAESAGLWAVAVERGEGEYSLHLALRRAPLEDLDATQVLFLDFDGAVYDADVVLGGNPGAVLSPLEDFLDRLGLEGEEDAVIDRVIEIITENLADDVASGLNPDYDIELRTSRDDADPWGDPHVSRIIVGGTTEELGLNTVGIAESIDVGNQVTAETAIVLLDRLTGPRLIGSLGDEHLGPGVGFDDVLGVAIGNIASHEAGHLFANFHTGHPDYGTNLMDGNMDLYTLLGMGPDSTFGTGDDADVDFGIGGFYADEGITGTMDTRNAIAFGLFGADAVSSEEPVTAAAPFALGGAWPNPFNAATHLTVRMERAEHVELAAYDLLGRRVRVLHRGTLAAGDHAFSLSAQGLAAGRYLVRIVGVSGAASKAVFLAR